MKVLVPVDGKELLPAIVPAVRRVLGADPDAEIHLLRVLDPRKVRGRTDQPVDVTGPSLAGTTGPVVAPPLPRLVESRGEAMERVHATTHQWLGDVLGKELPGVEGYSRVEWSRRPAAKILAVAAEIDADVILMATHGRAGVSLLIEGSVTEEVIRESTRPVLVVGPAFLAAVNAATA